MLKLIRSKQQPVALLLLILMLTWQIGQPLHGATIIWDGDLVTTGAQDATGTFTWAPADAKFWNGSADVATTNDATTDIAQFGNGGTLGTSPTINVSTQSINGLIFGATTTSGYTLTASATGNILTIGNGGIIVNSGAQATAVGSANLGITLGAAQTWTNNSASTLTVQAVVNGGFLLTLDGTGNTTIAGLLSGTGGITKNGAGTASVTGTDPSFTGAVTVNAGTLVFGTATTDFTVATVNGGTLRGGVTDVLSNNLVMALAPGGTYDIRGTDTIAAIIDGTGGGGTVTVGSGSSTLTVSNATNRAFSGVMQNGAGTLSFTKAGTNTVTLTGANTYTGTTSITDGTLTVSGATGTIQGSATITIGDNNGASEVLNVGAVGDAFVGGSAGRLADAAAITLNGGGTLNYNGPASGFTSEAIGSITASNGRSIITLTPGTGSEITLAGTSIARTNSGILLVRGNNLGTTGTGNTRLTFSTAPTGVNFIGGGGAAASTNRSIVPYVIGDTTVGGAGSGFVTYDATNGLIPLILAEYATTISAAAATDNVSLVAADTAGSAATINALRVTAGGTGTALNAATTVTSGAVLFTGSASLGGSGSMAFGATQGMLTAAANTTAITGAINTVITGTGGLVVNSTGSATNIITLGGNNTFIGGVVAGSGILRLGNAGALNSTAPNTLTMRTGAILELNGNNTTIVDLTGAAGSIIRNLTSAATTSTLTINQANAGTFTGSIVNGNAGAVINLVKTGAGTLTLSGTGVVNSSYTGTTTLRAGTLVIGTTSGTAPAGAALSGTSSVLIESGATFRLSNSNTGNNSGDRLNNSATVFMHGGVFDYNNNADSGQSYSETVAALTLSAGANTLTVDRSNTSTTTNRTSTLTFASLTRTAGSGTTLELTSEANGTAVFGLGTNDDSRLVFTTAPSEDDNILPYAVVRGALTNNPYEFVKYDTTPVTSATAALAADYAVDTATSIWEAANNIKLSTVTAPALSTVGTTSINSLNFQTTSNSTLDITSGRILRVESGGILASQAGTLSHAINNGTLTAGNGVDAAGELMFHVFNVGTMTLTVGSTIADNGTGSVSLTKAGTGTLKLSNTANTFTGAISLNRGTLQINGGGSLGAGPASTTANFLRFNGGNLQVQGDSTLDAKIGVGISAAGATITVDPTFTATIGGIVADNSSLSSPGALTKNGTGALVLSGANTYTGLTSVNNGTLRLNGSTNTSAITVNGGTTTQGTLGGTGTITGGVTLATNGATSFAQGPTLNPGNVGAAGTLTINTTGLTTNDFSSLTFDLNTATTVGGGVNDLISTDVLPFFAGSTQININALSSLTAGGTYTLISGYTGTLTSFANLSLNSIFAGETKSGVLLNNSGQLQLLVTGATPATAYWAGDRDVFWNSIDTGTAATNWRTDISSDFNTFALPGAATDVYFYTTAPAAGNINTTLGASFTIKSLTFAATAVSAVSVSGGSLTLTPLSSSTGLTLASGAGAVTINSDVVLGAAQTWTNNSTNALTVNGEVSGAFSLTKAGTGTVILSGANIYSGGTTLSAGTLTATSSQALGLAANVLSLGGGTLNLASDTSTTAKNTTVTGNVTVNSNLATAGAGITHTLGTLSIGAQTLSITKGANVTSGTAGVTFGATTFTGAPVFDTGAGANLTLGAITNSSNFATIKQGSGTLSIVGANTSTGTLSVNGGLVTLNASGRWTGDITVASGGTLQNTGAGTNSLVNTLTVQSGGVFDMQQTGTETIAAFNLEGSGIGGTGALVNNGTSAAGTLTSTAGMTLTGDAVVGGTSNLTFSGNITGAFSLTKVGANTLTVGNTARTFSGGLIVKEGTVIGTTNAATFGAGAITLGDTTGSANASVIATGTGATFTNVITVAAGSSGNTLTFGANNGNAFVFSGAVALNNALTLNESSTGSINMSGQITGSQAITVNSTGTGTVTLSGNNTTYTGAITVKSGVLSGATNLTAFGTQAITLGDSTGSANTTINLALTGNWANPINVASGNTGVATLQTSADTGAFSGAITLNTHALTLAMPTNNMTLSGGITGTGNVSITGTAAKTLTISTTALSFTGNLTNDYTGTGAGVVTISSNVNITGAITNNSTSSSTMTVSGIIGTTVTGVVQNSATSSLTLGAVANTWTGGLTIKAGSVLGGNNANTFGGNTNAITLGDTSGSADTLLRPFNSATYLQPITVKGGNTGIATLMLGTTTGNVVWGGAITLDTHALTIAKQGTTGATQVTGGITGTGNLTIDNDGTTGTITLATGAINPVGSITNTGTATGATTISADIGGNVTDIVQSSASSFLTLSGTNISYTGATTVNAGVLRISGGSGTPLATSAVTVAAGAVLGLGNSAGQAVNLGSGALNLGAGTGTATLVLELGANAAGSDRLVTSAVATTANTVAFSLSNLAGFGTASNYNLISAGGGGLSGATYSLASAPGGYTYSFTTSDTLVQLNLAAASGTGSLYWRGNLNGSWSAFSGAATNWFTDADGTTNAGYNPTTGNTVIFSTTNATGPTFATTLDANYFVNALQFTASPTGVTSVFIAPGLLTPGLLSIAPSASSAGISVAADAGAIAISAPLVLGAAQTWSVDGTGTNGSSLAISGAVTGVLGSTLSITGGGTGVVSLSAAAGLNTYSGPTTVSNGGILQGTVAGNLSANSAMTVNGTGILRLNGVSNTVPSLAGSGTVQNNHASTGATLTVGDSNSTTFSGVLQNGGVANLSLTKTGTGALTLSGANVHTGSITVSAGTLNLTGSWTGNTLATSTLALGGTPGNTVTNVSGNIAAFGFTGGNVSGSVSIYNQTAGDVLFTGNTTSAVALANALGGYGYLNLTGGTFKVQNRFALSTATASLAGAATGVIYVDGNGLLDLKESEWTLNYNHSQVTVAGNGVIDRTGATASYGIIMNSTVAGSVYGVLNVAGGSFLTTTQPIRFGNSGTAGAGNNNTAIINVAGGTLQVGVALSTSLPSAGNNRGYINFAGGTLKTSAGITNWIPTSATGITFTTNLYGAINNSTLSGAPSFAGGMVFDSNGFDSSIGSVLGGATGSGVAQSSLSVIRGTGYVGAPEVIFSGGTLVAGGSPASGYALISGGEVTGIVITSPGSYTVAPTVTLTGGGGSGASVTVGTLVANTSGGLTKIGAGMLTLSGTNTYTGGTTVTDGTLALGANDVLANAGAVTVNGGIFDINSRTDTVGTVTLQSGSITGSTGVLTSTAAYELQSGSVSAILAGSVGVNKSTTGTVTLSGVNTFNGIVNVTAGALAFAAAGNLGDGSAGNDITLGGGTLQFTGTTALDIDVDRQISLTNGTTSTIEVTSSTGILQVTSTTNGITASGGAANLTKTGIGELQVTASPLSLSGGTLTVNAGTVRGGLASTFGAIDIKSGATLNLYDGAAVASAITGLTLTNGASLGFDLGASGVNDVLNLNVAPNITATVLLNFNNLGGMSTSALGTYDLININTTTGTFSSANFALGLAPSGFNYEFMTANAGQTLRLKTTPLVLRYWTGDFDGNWNTNDGPGNTNWASDAAGTELGDLPAATDTLVFSATNANAALGVITTSLNNVGVTADSLRFVNAPTNPATTTLTIASGGGSGILTINPISTNNGISVSAQAGDITISAPVVAQVNQTWEVEGTSPSSLTVSGDVTFTGSVTKTGAGTLTLSGANSGEGGFNLAGGTVLLSSSSAVGAGAFTVNAGTIFDSTVADLTLTAGSHLWNGSFTFTGTNNLNMATGAITLSSNLTVTTTGGRLTIGGVVGPDSSTFVLTKAGAGTLELNGNNIYDGLTTLSAGVLTLAGDNSGAAGGVAVNAGTLNLKHIKALGAGTFTIAGGTLDNTSSAELTLTTNNTQAWNGSFVFTGTDDLNLGTGAVVLGATPTVTVNAKKLTVGGNISGGFGLTKAGAGTLELGGINNYTGTTSTSAGTFNLTGTMNGDGNLAVSGGTMNISGTWSGSGTLALSGGTMNLSGAWSGAGAVTVNTATMNISGALSGSNAVSLGGATGAFARLNILNGGSTTAGIASNVLIVGTNNTNARAMVTLVTGGTLAFNNLTIGAGGTAAGAIYQTGGALQQTAQSGTTAFAFGSAASSYAYYKMTGGTASGSEIGLGAGVGTTPAGGTGILEISGGTFSVNKNGGANGYFVMNRSRTNNQSSLLNLSGTGTLDVTQASGGFIMNYEQGDTQHAVINVMGGTLNAAGVSLNMNRNAADGTQVNSSIGILNLTGGTMTVNAITNQNVTATASNLNLVNFNGGTLRAGANAQTLLPVLANGAGYLATSGVYIYSGGATIDTNGFATTTISAPLLAPTGVGVQNIAITNDGAGYIGAPIIRISGGTGVGATAIANMVDDLSGNGTYKIGSITITNSGTGYTAGDNLIITVVDNAGARTTQAVLGAVTFNAGNTSGGLTKTSAGTLILSAANTYTGATTISGGTLQIGAAGTTGSLSINSAIVNNANLTFNRTNAVAQGTDFSTAIITGTGSLTQAGTATLTLNAANTYQGGTSITGANGIISATVSEALGTGTITFAGGRRLSLGSGVTLSNEIIIGTNSAEGSRGMIEAASGTATVAGDITINNSSAAGGHFASVGAAVLNLTGVITSSVNVAQRLGNVIYSGGGTGYSAMSVTGTAGLGANNGFATTVTIDIGTSGTGNLDLAGFNQTLVGITKGASAANIGNSSTTADSVLTTTGTSAFAGVIKNVLGSGTRTVGLTVNGGVLTLSGANTYTGVTTLSAGTLSVGTIGDGGVASSNMGSATNAAANWVFDGGTLQYAGATASTDRNFTINAGKVATIDVSVAATTLTLSGASPATNGGMAKTGLGTLALAAVNTYTGATNVSAGALQVGVSGTGSTDASSTVTLNGSSAVLAGSGTVNGSVVVSSGQISPGDSSGAAIGTLTIGGDATLTGGGSPATRLTLQLAATLASTINDAAGIQAAQVGGTLATYLTGKAADYDLESGSHDKLVIIGALNLNTGGRIALDNTLGYSFAFGDVFDLLDWGSINTDFDGAGPLGFFDSASDLLLPSLGSGLAFNTSLFSTNGIIVVVPEPSRALLLLFGLLGLMLRRRRR